MTDEAVAADFGRRVNRRRRALGLSLEDVAERAGMDPGFVGWIERRPSALTAGAVIRLADALDTTVADLLGSHPAGPPGHGRAAVKPVLEPMERQECLRLLGRGGIGRVAFAAADRLMVLPVNYTMVRGAIVFRTSAQSSLAEHAAGRVSFEVDRIDDGMREGWSVLVTGTARVVTEPELHLVKASAAVEPWAGGHRDVYVVVDPDEITGRRIRAW